MTTLADITTTYESGVFFIDALVSRQTSIHWNAITPFRATLYYTFAVDSGTEEFDRGIFRPGMAAFNATQAAAAREIMEYVSQLTGIDLVETSSGSGADIHFASYDLAGNDTGITQTYQPYSYTGNTVFSYAPEAYIYLDNGTYVSQNFAPVAGTYGYETLLHEVGHALGLKHPFEGDHQLPIPLDTTALTLMSYTFSGGPYSTFREYDLAALGFLYGGDGLGGWGSSGTSYVISYPSGNENIAVQYLTPASEYSLYGQEGQDNIEFPGLRADYALSAYSSSWLLVQRAGIKYYVNRDIETLSFQDRLDMPVADLINGITDPGTNGNDTLVGTVIDNRFDGKAGNDSLDGGAGTDTAQFSGNRAGYTVTHTASGYTVADGSGSEGTDTLANIEILQFADQTVDLEPLTLYGNRVQAFFLAWIGRTATPAELMTYSADYAEKAAAGQTVYQMELYPYLHDQATFLTSTDYGDTITDMYERLTGSRDVPADMYATFIERLGTSWDASKLAVKMIKGCGFWYANGDYGKPAAFPFDFTTSAAAGQATFETTLDSHAVFDLPAEAVASLSLVGIDAQALV